MEEVGGKARLHTHATATVVQKLDKAKTDRQSDVVTNGLATYAKLKTFGQTGFSSS